MQGHSVVAPRLWSAAARRRFRGRDGPPPGVAAVDAPAAQPARSAPRRAVADAETPASFYRWLILLGLITSAIMEVLDTTIVNVALPQMAGNLSATTTEIAWVSTG